jgi:hypothetical protein
VRPRREPLYLPYVTSPLALMSLPGRAAWSRFLVVLPLVALLGAVACTKPLDTTRHDAPRGTLGEEMYRVLCERMASEEHPADVTGSQSRALCHGEAAADASTTPRLRALAERREKLIRAFDQVLPASLEDDLEGALLDMLPLYDPPSDRMPRWATATAEAVGALAADPAAIETLERLSSREGYRPLSHALGVARPILNYERFDDFAAETLQTILDKPETSDAFWDLVRASGIAMAAATPSAEPPGESTFDVARDLLIGDAGTLYVAHENLMVHRDRRGLAQVAPRGMGLPAPFVDMDGDQLADVDSVGRFTDHGVMPLLIPTPFPAGLESNVSRDSRGRALGADGLPLYAYFDANRTFLAGLLYDTKSLTAPASPALLDLTAGIPVLLGASQSTLTTVGNATWVAPTFDTRTSPLLDLVHAAGVILADPRTDDVLGVLDTLLAQDEAVVSHLIDSGLSIDRQADASDASLPQPNIFWDDVIQAATWMAAEPGLTEAVLRALTDPHTKRLGPIIADFMRKRDFIEPFPFDPNGSLADFQFKELVDRNAPGKTGNQSLFQRVASVIHDMDQAKVCNQEDAQVGITVPLVGFSTLPFHFAECTLIEIDNMAKLFSQSVIGRAQIPVKKAWVSALTGAASAIGIGYLSVDELFQRESKVTGLDTSPTPEALARMQFMPQNKFLTNIFDVTRTRDGLPVSPRHDGTIFACEKKYRFNDGQYPSEASFYDVMGPFLRAFDDYDRGTVGEHLGYGVPSERFIFGEFIAAIHNHWGGPADDTTQSTDRSQPSFAHHDNVASYEPLIAYAMDDAKLVLRLHELAVALEGIEVSPGRDGIAVLAAGVESLLSPIESAGITRRDGTTTTTRHERRQAHPPCHTPAPDPRRPSAAWTPPSPPTKPRTSVGSAAAACSWTAGSPPIPPPAVRASRIAAPSKPSRFCSDLPERGSPPTAAKGTSPPGARAWARDWTTPSAILSWRARFASWTHLVATPAATNALAGLLEHLTRTDVSVEDFNSTVLAGVDLFQFLDDEQNLVPLLRALSRIVAPNAQEVVASGGDLDIDGSAVGNTIELLADVQKVDQKDAILAVLRNAVALDPTTGETPLETILDALVEVNRATPPARAHPSTSKTTEPCSSELSSSSAATSTDCSGSWT